MIKEYSTRIPKKIYNEIIRNEITIFKCVSKQQVKLANEKCGYKIMKTWRDRFHM